MREIHYNEVLVSYHKGTKRTVIQRLDTWVIGAANTMGKINTNKSMLKQLEARVYPSKYKGVRKLMVINIISTKYLGDSFYYT
jgi:hypothetical protein|tara:strand:+ start:2657 stop:2905 length:249 start_codon:yes stop_codon:yes gene_type:complete